MDDGVEERTKSRLIMEACGIWEKGNEILKTWNSGRR